MKKFFLAVTIIMGLVLTLDVIAYPNFVLGKLGVSSAWGLFGYTVLGLLGSIRWRFLPEKVIAWNKRFVFPVLAVVCSCLIVLELTHYPNYVYSLFRIDLFAFSYLTLFSGILLYLFAGDYARKIPGFYIGMPLGLMSMLVIVLVSPDWFVWIVQEDGVIEYFQFGLYCVSCLFATKLALYFKRDNQIWLAVVFGILAFGLFFVSGEEISWGQRVLGIETPESIKEVNLQDEITLHNLDYFQHPLFFDMSYLHFAYTSVGLYGAFSRWIGVFIREDLSYYVALFTPDLSLFFAFFSLASFYFLHDFVLAPYGIFVGNVPVIRWQEVFESFLSLGFFGYTSTTYYRVVQSR